MFVKYFIPEDGDEQDHPNMFMIEFTQPTLAQLRKELPVAGKYHFRYLKNIGAHIVWFDAVDEDAVVPLCQGAIFLKLSRVSPANYCSNTGVASIPGKQNGNQQSPDKVSVNFNGEPLSRTSQPAPNKAPKPVVERRNSEKLLNFDDSVGSPPAPTSTKSFSSPPISSPLVVESNDLLGMDSSGDSGFKTTSAQGASSDLFGLDTLKPTSMGAMGGSSGTISSSNSSSNIHMSMMGGGQQPPMRSNSPMTGGMGGSIGGGSMMGGGGNPMHSGRGMGGGVASGQSMGGGNMNRGQTNTGSYDPFGTLGGVGGMQQQMNRPGSTNLNNNGRR